VWHGAKRARALTEKHAKTKRVTIYATEKQPDANLWLAKHASTPGGLTFEPVFHGKSLGSMTVPLWGDFSAGNVLAVLGALHDANLTADELRAGFASFAGVRRRMEVRGTPDDVTVVDDFAHHPTAVQVTLAAARTRWPGRKIWALFEPRSATSRRNVFQKEYIDAFLACDCAVIASHERLREIPEDQRFDPVALANDIKKRGGQAHAIADVDGIVDLLARETKAGDVVMVLSNGDFGGLHDKLLKKLERRA